MYTMGMLTRRNTKDEMLALIDKQEKTIERLKESKQTYVKSYEYQKTILTKRDDYIKHLLVENYVHMQGKIRLQDDLFERDLIIHSLMNN